MGAIEHVSGRSTIFDKVEVLEEHFHGQQKVYPSLDDPVTLTAGGTAWAAYPAPTEIVPASTITEDFDIHFCQVSGISANGDYQIALYTGGAGSEVLLTEFAVTRNAAQSQEGSQPIITRIIAKNTRISGAISSGNAAADTLDIKIEYHEY